MNAQTPNRIAAQQKHITPIIVGKVRILIPNPPGFGLVTPEMSTTYEYQSHFVSDKSLQYACFIPDSQIVLARNKNFLPLPLNKSFRIQTAKLLETDLHYSTLEIFNTLRENTKQKNTIDSRNLENVQNQIVRTNDELVSLLKYDPKLSLLQSIPVKGYEETNQSIFTSMFARVTSDNAEGKSQTYILSATQTIIYVNKKILFLYAYGTEADLNRIQSLSRNWAKDILLANSTSANLPILKKSKL